MDSLTADLRYALRLLRKSPVFAAVAIATLALGIGATTAIFSAVDTVLIRRLPYADPNRLVMVWEDISFAGRPHDTPSPGNYYDWMRRSRSFTGMAATRGATASLTGDGAPEQVSGRATTANFFGVLGVRPVVGRTFTDEEDRTGAAVVVISYSLWQRRYDGDPSIVGRTLLMSDYRYEVVGVMPPAFVFRDRAIDYWVPIRLSPALAVSRNSHFLNVVGRLAPGVSFPAAADDMRRIGDDLAREFPTTNTKIGVSLVPLKEDILGDTRVELLVLMGAAAAILLIACANLAGLLLSRAASRRGELAVRCAIGATTSRLVRQMIVEATVLALAGGALGIGVAAAGVTVMGRLVPRGIDQPEPSVLDTRLLLFAFGVSLATGLLFSLLPAIHAARASVRDTLQHSSRTSAGGPNRVTRDALVVLQLASALALLVSAGLLLRTLANLTSVDLGFRPDHVLTLRTALPPARSTNPRTRLAFYDRVVADANRVAGVAGAAYASNPPFMSAGDSIAFRIEGRPPFAPGEPNDALLRVGTPHYLRVLGTALLSGRLRDGPDAPPVVVVNETMARTYWDNDSPLGAQLRIGVPTLPPYTIVGVVADVVERGYERAQKPAVYLSYGQALTTWALPEYLVVRTAGAPETIAGAMRQIVGAIDADQPVSSVRTLEAIIGLDIADRREQLMLLGAFAALALLLASLGLYGVLSYAVSQRSRELGLRIALGATTGSVMRIVIGRGIALTTIGLAIGGALAWAAARAMTSVLHGVTPGDRSTYGAVAGLLATIALVATYLPARRAARLDPSEVLRAE